MGRRKIEIKAIKDDRNRSVTFLKRKGGLFKKAHELSVLCSVDVAVFIFGQNKKLYEYSSGNMQELIARHTYHGVANEHKGPSDFNGGMDDDDEDGEGTPPHVLEGSVEPQMMPPQYSQPPFHPHLRGPTPSASPPISHMAYVPRGHTPTPQMGSRPSSRGDFRRPNNIPQGPPPPPPQQVANGYAFMPQPAIYNPQSQPPMQPGLTGPYGFSSPQPHPQMQAYMDDQRRSVPPPNQSQYPPPSHQPTRPSPPQVHQQQLPLQATPQMSPPQPPSQHLEVPQQQPEQQQEPQPPAPMDPPPTELPKEKPSQPLLDTTAAIQRNPGRKHYSIFTPVDDKSSMLGRHLDAFGSDDSSRRDDPSQRSQSVDSATINRASTGITPAKPQRANTSALAKSRSSLSSIPEKIASPPTRSDSMKSTGGARPRLTVQIPEEASEAGSNTAGSSGSHHETSDTTQRTSADAPGSVVVLPPPSPSASTLLSAGATGPPNPFARPPPHTQNNAKNNDETPGSALPSRFLTTEFLPSPSSFYPEWNFRGNDSNTLPSPLNFATPVHGSGPSFLRDDGSGAHKRKSPDYGTNGHDGPEGLEPKRVKVDG
jgi:MADS-box transcription factor